MKIRKSITIDRDVSKKIDRQAKGESRNFSNMIEKMSKSYLEKQKKKK